MSEHRTTQISTQRRAMLKALYEQNVRPSAPTARRAVAARNRFGRGACAMLGVLMGLAAVLVSWTFTTHFADRGAGLASASAVLRQQTPSASVSVAAGSAHGAPHDAASGNRDADSARENTTSEQSFASRFAATVGETSRSESAAASTGVFGPGTEIRRVLGLTVKTIVIDAGHGGHDPGTSGELGTREKDIALDVARRLARKLGHGDEYRVLLVRDRDVFVPLNDRAAYANDAHADLFVSVHVNYLPGVSANSVETYYFGRHDGGAASVAERENRASQYALSDLDELVKQMRDTMKLQESKTLAREIHRSLVAALRKPDDPLHDNGVRTAPFVVLLGVKAPSVLVEIASLSSAVAEERLRTETYRDEVASAIASGITRYLTPVSDQEKTHGYGSLAQR